MHPKELDIADFDYELPDSKIPSFPTPERDLAKLLVYRKGEIASSVFRNLAQFINDEYLLVMNDTRVIPARLLFSKTTGAIIEVFCLEPHGEDHQVAMAQTSSSTWKCMIGGAKKWKEGLLELSLPGGLSIFAERLGSDNGAFIVRFTWNDPSYTFSQILQNAGALPLPPYFEREATESDYDRYQTVFAENEGSVAAPTAALHFTDGVFQSLTNAGVESRKITLHVGAGTFKPVTASTIGEHSMHAEVFSVSFSLIEELSKSEKKIITVGTTTTRTLESLYWFGVKLLSGYRGEIKLEQWEPYSLPQHYSLRESLEALLKFGAEFGLNELKGSTSLIIAPGYTYRIAKGIITNFHLPKSTLILLVAAFIGEDWRKVYDFALSNDFRFLSYGDSSLLLP